MQIRVVRTEIFNFLCNLRLNWKWQVIPEDVHGLRLREGKPAFIDNRLIFLFQFYKNRIVIRSRLITSNTQLFFI